MVIKLSTCLLPAHQPFGLDAAEEDVTAGVEAAVVIDVLRATSVMVTALGHGASRIITCREVDEARQLSQQFASRPLLCGERGCQPIDGFDLGNSPAEYERKRVEDRVLVLTTTNGTRAIAAVERVPRLLIASFLNLSAVVDAVTQFQRVHLVCAGTEGHVTLEDVLLAGAILWKCQSMSETMLVDDDSVLALQLWQAWFAVKSSEGRLPEPDALSRRFRETRGGRNLLRLGYESDLQRCAAIDSIGVVPRRVKQSPATFALGDGVEPIGCT